VKPENAALEVLMPVHKRRGDGSQLFKKGVSGNPSGRPHRLSELQALAQTNYPAALERLKSLIHSEDEEMAFKAVSFTFLYILGKPPEGRDLLHVENMRARLSELVFAPVPAQAALAEPSPRPLPESVPPSPPALDSAPPEAAGVTVTLASEPSGLRCLYRTVAGQCGALTPSDSQWCEVHKAKLFSMMDK
jgi:hypothetical protein